MGYKGRVLRYYGSPKTILDTETSLWLKGDNPNNTNIRWYDASPNNYVLNGTATLTANVLNGQKGYDFNGSTNFFVGGDILDIGLKSRTIYAISKCRVLNSYFGVITKATADVYSEGGWVHRGTLGAWNTVVQANNVNLITPNIAFQNNTFIKTRGIIDRTNSLLKCKYLTTENTLAFNYPSINFNTSAKLVIGGLINSSNTIVQNFLNGIICEIIVIDRLLTTEEDTYIQTYLNTKYGL